MSAKTKAEKQAYDKIYREKIKADKLKYQRHLSIRRAAYKKRVEEGRDVTQTEAYRIKSRKRWADKPRPSRQKIKREEYLSLIERQRQKRIESAKRMLSLAEFRAKREKADGFGIIRIERRMA
jgi:hypothetical protein